MKTLKKLKNRSSYQQEAFFSQVELTNVRMIYTVNEMVTMEPTGISEKSEPQMGFEPTTLRDLVGCSNH